MNAINTTTNNNPQVQVLINVIEETVKTATLPPCTDDTYVGESYCCGRVGSHKSIYGIPVPEGHTSLSDLLYRLAMIDLRAGITLARKIKTNKTINKEQGRAFSDVEWLLPDGSVFKEQHGLLDSKTISFANWGRDGQPYLVNVRD